MILVFIAIPKFLVELLNAMIEEIGTAFRKLLWA